MGRAKPKTSADVLTRNQAIEALCRPGYLGLCFPPDAVPELQGFPPEERKAIYREAERRDWERRERERLPVLLERLRNDPVETWGNVFAERPDLKELLDEQQRAQWTDFIRAVRARNYAEKRGTPEQLATWDEWLRPPWISQADWLRETPDKILKFPKKETKA